MNLGVAIKPKPEPEAGEEKKVGSIFIPTTAKAPSMNKEGEVVAVGFGLPDRPMEVSVGDRVFYKKGNYPESNGCEIVSLDDILYVI